jgi:hypothetical protein
MGAVLLTLEDRLHLWGRDIRFVDFQMAYVLTSLVRLHSTLIDSLKATAGSLAPFLAASLWRQPSSS